MRRLTYDTIGHNAGVAMAPEETGAAEDRDQSV
jgi:hypothetical protein